jgi:hypothetical protein
MLDYTWTFCVGAAVFILDYTSTCRVGGLEQLHLYSTIPGRSGLEQLHFFVDFLRGHVTQETQTFQRGHGGIHACVSG